MQLTRVIVLAAGIAACNGLGSSVSGGFGGSVSGPDGIGGPVPPSSSGLDFDCPAAIPKEGAPCSGHACLYGGEADPSCNTIARCSLDFTWVIEAPHCPASCPEHFDDRKPGEACGDPDVCTYLEATCGCVGAIRKPTSSVDGGDGGDDAGADADAGDPDASAPIGHWQCVRPGNGCPARRPATGTRCVSAMTCDYGSCLFGVPLTYECVPAAWTEAAPAECP